MNRGQSTVDPAHLDAQADLFFVANSRTVFAIVEKSAEHLLIDQIRDEGLGSTMGLWRQLASQVVLTDLRCGLDSLIIFGGCRRCPFVGIWCTDLSNAPSDR